MHCSRAVMSSTALALLSVVPPPLAAQTGGPRPVVRAAAKHDVSPPLRGRTPLRPRGPVAQREHEVRKLPPLPRVRGPLARDSVLQDAAPRAVAFSVTSFAGIGSGPSYTVRSVPPDTTGAAGDAQYVQWVNTAFAVFDKRTGATLYGPADGQTLWEGFGDKCETENDGDPVVLYDRLAKRWLMTQFAVTGGPPFFECVAVSTTPDALGSYARYAFEFDALNDYPKFGVWPDAYYVSFNMFSDVAFLGGKACALERKKMLASQPARMVCFDESDGGLLPSDLDGRRKPPRSAPNYFVSLGGDRLNLWKLRVNWSNPAGSTFEGPAGVAVAPFEPACGDGGACISQPAEEGSAPRGLDALSDRLMYRLAYRRNGSHQSLVVNHSVTADATTGKVGVRWYELRDPSGTPRVHQQGTYAPDGASRWMGSVAMDGKGNVALGYSVSSASLPPSIRVAGRAATDAPGTLGAEVDVVRGRGAQAATRWGDYASLTVDPVDDCTFWFSTEHLNESGSFNWQTRVANFKFPDCN